MIPSTYIITIIIFILIIAIILIADLTIKPQDTIVTRYLKYECPLGPTGPKGPRGVRGPIGERGLTGQRGPQGPKGKMGTRIDGPKGPQGATGSSGYVTPGSTGPGGNNASKNFTPLPPSQLSKLIDTLNQLKQEQVINRPGLTNPLSVDFTNLITSISLTQQQINSTTSDPSLSLGLGYLVNLVNDVYINSKSMTKISSTDLSNIYDGDKNTYCITELGTYQYIQINFNKKLLIDKVSSVKLLYRYSSDVSEAKRFRDSVDSIEFQFWNGGNKVASYNSFRNTDFVKTIDSIDRIIYFTTIKIIQKKYDYLQFSELIIPGLISDAINTSSLLPLPSNINITNKVVARPRNTHPSLGNVREFYFSNPVAITNITGIDTNATRWGYITFGNGVIISGNETYISSPIVTGLYNKTCDKIAIQILSDGNDLSNINFEGFVLSDISQYSITVITPTTPTDNFANVKQSSKMIANSNGIYHKFYYIDYKFLQYNDESISFKISDYGTYTGWVRYYVAGGGNSNFKMITDQSSIVAIDANFGAPILSIAKRSAQSFRYYINDKDTKYTTDTNTTIFSGNKIIYNDDIVTNFPNRYANCTDITFSFNGNGTGSDYLSMKTQSVFLKFSKKVVLKTFWMYITLDIQELLKSRGYSTYQYSYDKSRLNSLRIGFLNGNGNFVKTFYNSKGEINIEEINVGYPEFLYTDSDINKKLQKVTITINEDVLCDGVSISLNGILAIRNIFCTGLKTLIPSETYPYQNDANATTNDISPPYVYSEDASKGFSYQGSEPYNGPILHAAVPQAWGEAQCFKYQYWDPDTKSFKDRDTTKLL